MAGETLITIVGNLTDDPELRFTPSGAAVAKFRVASTPRRFKDGEWKDDEPLFMACVAWRQMAENAAETLQRGSRVVVVGRLKQRNYETREGEKRTVYELEAEEVAPSLKFATAKVQKMSRGGAGSTGGGFGSSGGNTPKGGFDDDPWATTGGAGAPATAEAQRANSSFDDEPPF